MVVSGGDKELKEVVKCVCELWCKLKEILVVVLEVVVGVEDEL